ncbi:hypothetical protein BC830DRAFT_1119977 [Chytriomyces sp. MP71]|nr:hypothetical protein BC830DRAFT_1119977 [Chytriomyces sp. MP71]
MSHNGHYDDQTQPPTQSQRSKFVYEMNETQNYAIDDPGAASHNDIHAASYYAGSANHGTGHYEDVYTSNVLPYDDPYADNYLIVKNETAFDKFERFCCCCCPKSKKGRIICWTVTATVVVVFAIVLYFFVPRMPQSYVNYVNPDVHGFQISYVDASQNLNTATLSTNFSMSISIFNPNSYALNLDALDLKVFMLVNQTAVYNPKINKPLTDVVTSKGVDAVGRVQTPSGYGNGNMSPQIATAHYGSLNLPSHSNITFDMTLSLVYTPDPNMGILKDPGVLQLAMSCGVTERSGKKGRIDLMHQATATIGAFKNLGIYPSTTSYGSFACPFDFNPDSVSDLEAKVNAGESVSQALKEVFGF